MGDNFWAERRKGTLFQQISFIGNVLLREFNRKIGQLLESQLKTLSEASDDHLRVNALFNKRLHLLEEFSGNERDTGSAVTNLYNSLKFVIHFFINWPARKLTSSSCERAISTRVLAPGWTMSNFFRMVAPSLEIVTSPFASTIILSMPRGPRVVRTASAIDWQAVMLLITWALPWEFSVPSFKRIIGGFCKNKNHKWEYYNLSGQ